MRTILPALASHLLARLGITAHVLIWIVARDRATGLPAPFGIWTGDDDRTFTIDGAPRLYLGAGKLVDVGDLVSEAGYVVRITRMSLSHLSAEISQMLTLREVRGQRVIWHQAHLQPGSHELVAAPRLVFKGRVERLSLPDAAKGEEVASEIEMASYAREMTMPLQLKKSDEALKSQHPGDTFRQYIAVSGKISTSWGEGRENGPTPPRQGPFSGFKPIGGNHTGLIPK